MSSGRAIELHPKLELLVKLTHEITRYRIPQGRGDQRQAWHRRPAGGADAARGGHLPGRVGYRRQREKRWMLYSNVPTFATTLLFCILLSFFWGVEPPSAPCSV